MRSASRRFGTDVGDEQHVVLLKYAPNGDLAWSRIDPDARGAWPVRLVISQGNVVVGATSYASSLPQYHVFAVEGSGKVKNLDENELSKYIHIIITKIIT